MANLLEVDLLVFLPNAHPPKRLQTSMAYIWLAPVGTYMLDMKTSLWWFRDAESAVVAAKENVPNAHRLYALLEV